LKEYPSVAGSSRPTGYSHVVAASGGKLVYVAGQISLDETGAIVGAGDLGAQARQVFDNLGRALTAAGATFADVIKLNTYVVGLDPSKLPLIRQARSGYLPATNPPASTLVGVTALAMDGLLIEVEAVAHVE
jgi:enamine deaminase RidA (YjgF/YER057c/UK114 family)